MAMSLFDDKSKQPTKQMLAKAFGLAFAGGFCVMIFSLLASMGYAAANLQPHHWCLPRRLRWAGTAGIVTARASARKKSRPTPTIWPNTLSPMAGSISSSIYNGMNPMPGRRATITLPRWRWIPGAGLSPRSIVFLPPPTATGLSRWPIMSTTKV